MIPIFPDFKKIDITSKSDIELFVKNYKPYSTFNFTNLFAWDVKNDRMVSSLNSNLILKSSDYETSDIFYTFLGSKNFLDTTKQLFQSASENKFSAIIRYIPGEEINTSLFKNLVIIEDRDNFDYIFSIQELASSTGKKYKEKRHASNKFLRENPNAIFTTVDLNNLNIQNEINIVLEKWEKNKKLSNKPYQLTTEEKAIKRLFENAKIHNLIISCIFIENVMIAFSIDQIVQENFAVAHFAKADTSFKGVYEFLNEKVAQLLNEKNVKFWNWQQDLNISGLRALKTSYNPVLFLKKYKVTVSDGCKQQIT